MVRHNGRTVFESRRPIWLAELFGSGWSQGRKDDAVACDDHPFSILNPLRHVRKVISQVSHACLPGFLDHWFYGDT